MSRVEGAGRQGLAVLAMGFVLVVASWGHPAAVFAASGVEPHLEMTSAHLSCQTCHLTSPVIYTSIGAPGSDIGPVSDAACVGCHVLPEGQGPKVYAGDEAHYRVQDGFGHNDPSKVSCLDCHSIHGPRIEAPSLDGKLLKELDYQPEAVASVDLATAPHDAALSVWCTGCHAVWPEPATGRPIGDTPMSAFAESDSGHPFAAKRPGRSWDDVDSCVSCHAAPGGFPHYTEGADAGLVGAASAGEPRVAVAERYSDGVCLACHRSSSAGGLVGVGITY